MSDQPIVPFTAPSALIKGTQWLCVTEGVLPGLQPTTAGSGLPGTGWSPGTTVCVLAALPAQIPIYCQLLTGPKSHGAAARPRKLTNCLPHLCHVLPHSPDFSFPVKDQGQREWLLRSPPVPLSVAMKRLSVPSSPS